MTLSNTTLAALVLLAPWFGLDFLGVPGLVDREPLISLAGVMLALLGLIALSGLARFPLAAPVYCLSLAIWAALQVETHWSTYLLFDATQRKLAWYAKVFGPHWRFLPELPHRTTPDGYHTILFALILLNLLLAARDCFRRD